MKHLIKITMLLFAILAGFQLEAQDLNAEISGTWEYSAEDAPYEYRQGKVEFYTEEGENLVKIITDYEEIEGDNLKVEGNEIVFEATVDYEPITVTLNLKDGKLTGNVDTVEGPLAISLTKQK